MEAATVNALLEEHEGLRWKCARRWVGHLDGFDLDDLLQELWLAMREAAVRWAPDRLPFQTFAWIVMERRVFLLRRRGLVRTPQKAIVQLKRHEFGPQFDRGTTPGTADELVELVGVSEAQLEEDPLSPILQDRGTRMRLRRRLRARKAA